MNVTRICARFPPFIGRTSKASVVSAGTGEGLYRLVEGTTYRSAPGRNRPTGVCQYLCSTSAEQHCRGPHFHSCKGTDWDCAVCLDSYEHQ